MSDRINFEYESNPLDKQYIELFIENQRDLAQDHVKKKLEIAYQRAYENRNLEINLFWTRSAFFWGFIAAALTGYLALPDKKGDGINADINYVKFYIACIGFILSVAWTAVIIGGKHWQKNWEMHLDFLEDYVTGPLFKTVYFKRTYFSVTKINLALSWGFIFLWIGIISDFLIEYSTLNFFLIIPYPNNIRLTFALAITLCTGLIMLLFAKKRIGAVEDKKGTFFYSRITYKSRS